ncbi:MAG: FtsW/RodA/SpoVE family cell cycle protein [Arcanobacterium sp.]|nr:FtsW/RodA/SpoVE family cell cycle protein [Arcanobacterium sp.]
MSVSTIESNEKVLEFSPHSRQRLQQAVIALFLAVSVLVVLGNIMVFSTTSVLSIRVADQIGADSAAFTVALRHLMFTGIGVFGGFFLSKIPGSWYQRFAYPIFFLGLALQTLVIFIGKDVAGNKNWLVIGSIQIQPSEFLKLATIVWLAAILGAMSYEQLNTPKYLTLPVGGLAIAAGIVVAPGDMGTGLIFALIGAGMLWLGGMNTLYYALLAAFVGLAGGAVLTLRSSRISRVSEYLNNLTSLPDTVNATQADHALFAFGTGGLTGTGLGASKEKWRDLREAHTDFIFAIIGEELGLFGALAVVLLFLTIAWSLYQIVKYHPDRFGRLVAAGGAIWICGQALLNMSVVTGLLPVFGVPLPFISQGGSAIMAALFMVGVIVSVTHMAPGVRNKNRASVGLAYRAKALIRKKRNG